MYGMLTGISQRASTKAIILTHTLLAQTIALDAYGDTAKKAFKTAPPAGKWRIFRKEEAKRRRSKS
jgi:hypothetical protein